MLADDVERPPAGDDARVDEPTLAEREREAARQPHEAGDEEQREREDDDPVTATDDRDQEEREQDRRKREHHVGQAEDEAIHPAAAVPGEQADGDPDHRREQRRAEADLDIGASREDQPAEDVAPVRVGPEQVAAEGLGEGKELSSSSGG